MRLAGPTTVNPGTRHHAIVALSLIGAQDEALKKRFYPLFKAALKEEYGGAEIINIIGTYGPDAKDLLPLLKTWKLSPKEDIRNAAADAVDKIENQ